MKCIITPYEVILGEYTTSNYPEILSQHDLTRSSKFVKNEDRDRFIASRMLCIRELLLINPSIKKPVEFKYGPQGKPFLENCLDFNWSHSGKIIALYMGPNAGIDVEMIRHLEISDFRNVFSNGQLNWIENDLKRFFTLWSVKESVMKACGLGFHLDPLTINPNFADQDFTWSVQIGRKTYFGKSMVFNINQDENYAISICSTSDMVQKTPLTILCK